MLFLQWNDRRLLPCDPSKAGKLNVVRCCVTFDIQVVQIIAWDLSLAIGRKFDIFHRVEQCDSQFCHFSSEAHLTKHSIQGVHRTTSKNRISKSFEILRNYKKSMTLSLWQPHRLFRCTCKSHHKLMKRALLLLVLDWSKRSGRSSIAKVVGRVNRMVGEPLMGCSAVILRHTCNYHL